MAPTVNHLLFVDDILLLFKASVEGSVAVSNLPKTCCSASGKKINHEKPSIFFSKGCPRPTKEVVEHTLQV